MCPLMETVERIRIVTFAFPTHFCRHVNLSHSPKSFCGEANRSFCVVQSLMALMISPRQHLPDGFLTSQAQRPAWTSALIRSGAVERPAL